VHCANIGAFVVALATTAFAAPGSDAHVDEARAEQARSALKAARRERHDTFCTAPTTPLSFEGMSLCPLASEIEDCAGFAAACEIKPAIKESPPWLESLGRLLASVAHVLLWLFVGAIITILFVPIVLAIARRTRDARLRSTKVKPNLATVLAPANEVDAAVLSDAESAMRLADEYRERGEYARATSLYLAAALAALANRGSIQLARHRTNGEYVRSCRHDASRSALREIVAEVDKTEFGHVTPTAESMAHVASRASWLVRTAIMTALVAMALSAVGCVRGVSAAADPAGDVLPMDVIQRAGFDVGYLTTSIASLPIPKDDDHAAMPIVVVDADKVPLDVESAAHLMRWVTRGGVLIVLGPPVRWPEELHASRDDATSRDLRVGSLAGARVARQDALVFPGADPVAHLGDKVYAAVQSIGRGTVLGIANDDLFTNAGVARGDNAVALVTLFDLAEDVRTDDDEAISSGRVVRVARRQDGVSPPTTPGSALSQSGLGAGTWHALGAALILFLAVGVRHARPRRAPAPARRAFREHVEATGAFYERAGASVYALASYGRFVEMRLRERLPRGTDPVAFVAARAGISAEEISQIYERATHAKAEDPPKGDELEVIEKLRDALVTTFRSS